MYKHYGLTGQIVRIRKKKLGSLEDDFDSWAYAPFIDALRMTDNI